MALIGLLFVALVCLILGLVLANGPFLIASIVASVLAAVVLFRQRDQLGGKSGDSAKGSGDGDAKPAGAAKPQSLVTGNAFANHTSTDPSHAKATAASATASVTKSPLPSTDGEQADVAASTNISASDEVWVVDGKPLFHLAGCDQIADADAQAVPHSQAIEDGFTECSKCRPAVGVRITQVWVVDGRPDYHRKDCEKLVGVPDEQIPRAQAVEDGFTPCQVCRPDGKGTGDATPVPSTEPAGAGTARSSGSPSDRVWVVDGRPRYHRENCETIADQHGEAIPLSQATEDGFIPCSMCDPATLPAAARA